ncbi:hypothetical protein D6I00_22550 [Salmonella enterica]|nr:hypothetical protein [Salmonella enterica]
MSEWLKEHAWKVCIRQRIGGSTTGAASWTDDEPARRLPAGRAQRVNPPLTAILKKELVRKYGLFFHLKPP